MVNAINKYAIKLLLDLTNKNIFLKYAPMYMAFSLIQIAREKYLDKELIKPKLFYDLVNIYGITPGDYIKCYGEIKIEIHLENDKTPKEEKSHNLKDRNENDINNELKTAEGTGSSKKFPDKNKNENSTDKFRSTKILFHIKENLITNNDNFNEKESPEKEKEAGHTSNEISKIKKKIKSKKSIPIPNLKTMEKFSIDCKNVNIFKSNDNLPFINPNSKERNTFLKINEDKMHKTHSRNFSLNKKTIRPNLNEFKHVKTNFKRFNSIELRNNNNIKSTVSTPIEKEQTTEKIKRKSKFYSFKNLDFQNNIKNNNLEIESTKKNKLTSKMLPKITGFEEFNMNGINNNNKEINKQNNLNKNKKHYKLKNIINNLEIKVLLPEDEINKNKDSNKKLEVF